MPAFPGKRPPGAGIIKDASRSSLGLLYHEQLYPQERVSIWLPKVCFKGTVVRCRKIDTSCYEVGIVLDHDCRLHDLVD